ncbi:MAG: DUF4974 domain-containing protein [Carboxylicivirga sp.]|jgi:ferric-dicitrate binding protein FerR (iron transport regulator)|nr:DUF4974 domain-containing protein [Carboxylicivirga sp.]
MNQYDDDIGRYLNDQMSSEEKLEFVNKLRNNHALKKEFFAKKDIWDYYSTGDHIDKFNKEELWQKISLATNLPKTKRIKLINRWIQIVGTVAAIVVTFWLGYFKAENKQVLGGEAHVFSTVDNQIAKVELSDGSEVVLNGNTKLTVPINFGETNRVVNLIGEAYFEVEHCDKQPFLVQSDQQDVLVLGTKFNVRVYPDENLYKTTLIEGLVEWTDGSQTVRLLPGMEIKYDHRLHNIKKETVDPSLSKSWITGLYEFRNASFNELAKAIEEWYGFQVDYNPDELKEYHLNGAFDKSSSLEENLELIKLMIPINYNIKENHVEIYANK